MDKQRFGFILGRFQPFHFGHQQIINEIILDGRIPVVLIGSTNIDRDLDKNPLTFEQREEMIKIIYSDIICINIPDSSSWDEWIEIILKEFGAQSKYCTLYYHNKEVDRYDEFQYDNITFKNEFYTKIFDILAKQKVIEGIKEIEFVGRTDIHIDANARDIRHNFEESKHLLDGRVYWYLKKLGIFDE
jgi:cytidyltransferase-like protein